MTDLALIQGHIETDLMAAGVQHVLPDHVKMSSFVRCAAIAITQGKGLAEADKQSVIMALTKCATDGLIPDGKEAALVVYNTKVDGTFKKMAQYLPMIDGVLKRARMSGQIDSMAAKAVYENDEFDYWLDENGEHLKYKPTFEKRGAFKLSFAFAKLKTGDFVVEVMTKEDIDKVKTSSKTSGYGPWVDWYERMACKTVFHRIAKRLPNSSEILEMCEAGMNMNFEKDMGPIRNEPTPTARSTKNMLDNLGSAKIDEIVKATAEGINKATLSVAQDTPEDDFDLVKFMLMSIDSCTTIEALNECGADIKVKNDEGEFDGNQLHEVRAAYDAALKSFKNQ